MPLALLRKLMDVIKMEVRGFLSSKYMHKEMVRITNKENASV